MVLTPTNPLHPAYELLAKGIYGYFSGDAATKLFVTTQFNSLGYSIDKVFDDPATSFQALGLISKDGTRPPVLVSQGTVDEKDSIDDANPKGVGFSEFTANKDSVKAWVTGIINDKTKNPADIKVDLTGQSLGGALAQWFASEYPDLIREAVTFQSPGITKAASDTFINKGGKSSQITHYIVNGDLISLGGEAFLPGTLRVGDYQTPAVDPEKFGDKHTAGILNANLPGIPTTVTNEVTIKLDDLNKPTFTFAGQDWQDFIGKLKQTNPTLAIAANSRSTVEAARIQSGSSAILVGQITQAVLTPNPVVPPKRGSIDKFYSCDRRSKDGDRVSINNDKLVLNVTKLTNSPTLPLDSPSQNIAEGRITDPCYAVEAIKKALANALITTNKTDCKTSQNIAGDAIYAPVVAQGTLTDFVNAGKETAIHAYSDYVGAISDKFDRFRSLGNNTFGVEDLYAGGYRDFTAAIDMSVKV
jgi:hypothetical protein